MVTWLSQGILQILFSTLRHCNLEHVAQCHLSSTCLHRLFFKEVYEIKQVLKLRKLGQTPRQHPPLASRAARPWGRGAQGRVGPAGSQSDKLTFLSSICFYLPHSKVFTAPRVPFVSFWHH